MSLDYKHSKIFILSALLLAEISCLSSARASSCEGEETSVPKAPSRQIQVDIFNEKMANLPVHADAIFVGDSLVQFWPATLMRQAARSGKIFNFGVGLDRTENVLWRLQSPQLFTLNPRNVVILIGANNLRTRNSPCGLALGVESIVERVGQIWPRANRILIQILPQGDGFTYRHEDRVEANMIAKNYLAGKEKVMILNFDTEITCNYTDSCMNYQADHVHLSESGYRVLTRSLSGTILNKRH